MDENKLDLETLERVKRICDIQSDMSSRTLGYLWVCEMIENLTRESQNSSTSDEALPIGDVGDSALTSCASNRDGECNHPKCPQILDNEPEKSGRSCPIYDWNHEDEV